MVNEQLKEYIRQSRQAGLSDDVIKENLRVAGWQEIDIEEGFLSSTYSVLPDFPHIDQQEPIKTNPLGRFDRKQILVFSVAGSCLILVLGLILVWYVLFYPKIVRGKVIKGMQGIHVAKIRGDIAFSETGGESTKITVDGYFNYKEAKSPKADFNLGLDSPLLSFGDAEAHAEGSFKVIGDKVYMKLNKVPGDEIEDISDIKAQWVYADLKSIESMSGSELPSTEKIYPKDIDNTFAKADIYESFKKVKGGKVDGVDCYRFDFVVGKEKLTNFVVEIAKAQSKDMKEEDINSLKESINESLKDVESIRGSIFSNKRGYALRKIELHIKDKDSSLDISLTLSDIGKEQEVKAPENPKNFEEFFKSVEDSAPRDPNRAKNSQIKASAARIQSALEDCYEGGTYPLLNDPCVVSKFDGGLVPKDNVGLIVIGGTYTLTADLEGEEDLVLKNKQ